MNKNYLKAMAGLFLLALLLYFAGLSSIIRTLSSTDLGLYGIAFLLFLATYIPITLRWQILSSAQGNVMGFWASFKVIAISYGFNKVLPANAGDLTRSKTMSRYIRVENHGKILGAVAVERALDIICLGGIVLLSSLFLASKYFEAVYFLVLPAVIGVTGILMLLWFFEMERLFTYLPGQIETFLHSIISGYRNCGPDDLVKSFALSITRWFAEVAVFLILASSVQINLGVAEAGFITSMMSLVAAFPISPGGIGPVDITGTGLLVLSGIGSATAASLVLLQRSLGLLLMGVIGLGIYSIENYSSSLSSE